MLGSGYLQGGLTTAAHVLAMLLYGCTIRADLREVVTAVVGHVVDSFEDWHVK